MKLIVNQVSIPESITFNYEELKQQLTAKAETYSAMVYTDADISAAKKDRADLNKFKKAVNDERIRQEKDYLMPFNDFKAKINEIISIIDEPINVIDSQIKSYEERQKAEKQAAIEAYWNTCTLPFETLQLEQIFDKKWLNASVNIKNVCKEVNARLEQIASDLSTLANLPDFSFEATETYKQSLDINKAISEGKRLADMQKMKAQMQAEEETRLKAAWEAEQARQAAEAELPFTVDRSNTVVENPTLLPPEKRGRRWLAFKAHLTVDGAVALREFFTSRNIEFEAI